jgi:hypothetical protein
MNKKFSVRLIIPSVLEKPMDFESIDDMLLFLRSFKLMKKEMTKLFSPLTKKELGNHLGSLSAEYVHDILRLILRPNHISSNHWLRCTRSRVIEALSKKMNISNRDLYRLYSWITDRGSNNSNLKLDDPSLEREIHRVRQEKYGLCINNNLDTCKKLIQSLHSSMNPHKWYTQDEAMKLVDKWYKSIPKK